MFEKNMRLAYLLDFYGDALDGHTLSIMRAYYDDDLSLSEIADGEGISRQGVRHVIKRGEEQLEFLEQKLGLAAHYNELSLATKKLERVKNGLSTHKSDEEMQKLLSEVIDTILNKGR